MEKSAQPARVHVRIIGRVQGVYFRASALQEAQNLGLSGWVRNCSDGSVELVAEGIKEKIEQLLDWCHRGPSGARVTQVEIGWETAESTMRGFVIRH